MRWMSYWELACVQRTITVYPVGQKQGFEEIGAQVTLNSPAFPPSRLLARNNLRIAPAILNPRTRVAPTQNCPRTTFIPSVWREVKIVVGRVHKVDAGTNELNTCERRYLPCLL